MVRRRKSRAARFRSVVRSIKTVSRSLFGLALFAFLGWVSWGGVEEESKTSSHQKSSMGVTEETGTTAVATMPSKRDGEIKVGTFNIRNFGKSQLSDPGVAATLAHIAMGFDVIAIQEISHKNGNALEALVAKMNLEEVGRFDYLVSTLLGKDPKRKGTDTEQFGFIYDKSRIELTDKNLGFVVSEKRFKTKFDRLPVVSSFKVKNELAKKPFTFTLVSFHNVPAGNRRWEEEVANLPSVYQEVRRLLAEEDDIVLLGDFNADSETILRGLAPLNQDFASAVPIEKTNVIQTKSYDNLVFDVQSTSEFIEGRVFNFSEVCKLYGADPRKVSDHFPVYATFAMEESDRGKRVASAVERELAPR